jgi:S-adenosylmethionine:tRNA ribosyltransferase-isomerase
MVLMNIREISMEAYRYDLPVDRIALYPLEKRDQSKLLVFRGGLISDACFIDLPDLLPPDSLLVWNNTKVIPARVQFRKKTGALIEVFLLEPFMPALYTSMFDKTASCVWNAIIGNQKKWKGESLERIEKSQWGDVQLTANYEDGVDKNKIFFKWTPEFLTFAQIIEIFGITPLPPYLKRKSNQKDKTDYQTVYASFDGSVAAPTAGLHFTPQVIERLRFKNIHLSEVTLHVGSGTFVPVKSTTIGMHRMHPETVIFDKPTILELMESSVSNLTVIGTTTMRSLESLFWLGQKISQKQEMGPESLTVDQWEPYENTDVLATSGSLGCIIKFMDQRGLEKLQFTTKMIIVPGYRFKLAKRLITNFHQPSSTLLLLVSALIGSRWKDVYQYALDNNYRFLSYGDSSLLEANFNNDD